MAGAARRRRPAIVGTRREPSSRKKDKREDGRAKEADEHAAKSTDLALRVVWDDQLVPEYRLRSGPSHLTGLDARCLLVVVLERFQFHVPVTAHECPREEAISEPRIFRKTGSM